MKAIVLLCVLVSTIPMVSAKSVGYFSEFCKGHAKCYSIFEDPFMEPIWDYDDFAFWGMDNWMPPYISWAESAAMAATFSQRFVHKFLGYPYDMMEFISAAHIILKMHSQSYVDDYFNCTVPNELGSFAMYIGLDNYLYSDRDIPLGFDPAKWCNLTKYQEQYNNWNGRRRYAYEMAEFEDEGSTFNEIKTMLWVFGMHLTVTSYCPDIMYGFPLWNPDDDSKYFCEPNPPTTMWGTIIIFGVMEDEEGLWYAAYFTEATISQNRLKWIRPNSRYYTEALQMFNAVYDTAIF